MQEVWCNGVPWKYIHENDLVVRERVSEYVEEEPSNVKKAKIWLMIGSGSVCVIALVIVAIALLVMPFVLSIVQMVVAGNIKELYKESVGNKNLVDWNKCLSVKAGDVNASEWIKGHGVFNLLAFILVFVSMCMYGAAGADAANCCMQCLGCPLSTFGSIWFIWGVVLATKLDDGCREISRKLFHFMVFCLCDSLLWMVWFCVVAVIIGILKK